MDIDKLIPAFFGYDWNGGFGSLMDIDKLIPVRAVEQSGLVLVL